MGKTNLLDAVHYLCFTKSYFTRSDANSVLKGQTGFRIEGVFSLHQTMEKAVCIFRETGKKEFYLDDKPYEKFSLHIGHYPCVIIAPDDAQLIIGGSEERRKFLDSILSQLDADYLKNLIAYQKTLQQRNAALRRFAETGSRDFELLDVLDEQLIKPGEYIFGKRKVFLEYFLPLVKNIYNIISGEQEDLTLSFESELQHTSLKNLLQACRHKDCLAQRSTAGIHRDDVDFFLNNQLFRIIASQGQRKSLLFALKLAELEAIKKEKGFAPLLLLDDVFEKLDETRIANLLHKVCVENNGQVFITDTNRERLQQHLAALKVNYQLIQL